MNLFTDYRLTLSNFWRAFIKNEITPAFYQIYLDVFTRKHDKGLKKFRIPFTINIRV